MTAEVHLVEETPSRVRFAHRPVAGLVVAAIGFGLAYLGAVIVPPEDGIGRWLMVGMGLFFGLAGLVGFLWRRDLVLDLARGRYHHVIGFWPAPSGTEGPLDQMTAVVLTRAVRSKRGQVEWRVGLEFEGWKQPVVVHATFGEADGYRQLERYARLVKRDAVDRCAPEEKRTPWTELDRSLEDRLAERGLVVPQGAGLLSPPAGSGIEVAEGGALLLLPPVGRSAGSWFLFLFGVAFGGMGAYPMLLEWGIGIPGEVTGPVWLVGPIFLLVGAALAAAALVLPGARQVVRDDRDALVVATRILGRDRFPRRLRKSEIEEVSLREPTYSHGDGGTSGRGGRHRFRQGAPEVMVRTDQALVRVGHAIRDSAGREWLYGALTALAAR